MLFKQWLMRAIMFEMLHISRKKGIMTANTLFITDLFREVFFRVN